MKPDEQWLRENRLFSSAVSGLWYRNPHAAGSINAIKIAGRLLYRDEGELMLAWIRRCSEFAAKVYAELEPNQDALKEDK